VRNQEAARYARWAAIAAGVITLCVGGVYGERAIRVAHARRAAPPVVPASVQQESTEISFSKTVEGRTLFTVRASRSTQYKDQSRYHLEDVWITIYGREGNRNDNMHAQECTYEPRTRDVRCEGEVRIDVQSAAPGAGKPVGESLEVITRNLAFDGNTGEATTPEPVEFSFPEGHGQGVGVAYSTRDAILRVNESVEFDVIPSERTGGLPASATGASLEVRRNDHLVVLNGPAKILEGDHELSASRILIALDEEFRARHATAEGHPRIHAMGKGAEFDVSADKFEAGLTAAGWVEHVAAEGGVGGVRRVSAGEDHFSAAQVEFTMLPGQNLLRDMTATGGVTAESRQGGESQLVKTESLRVTFAQGARPDQQRIASAETLAPGTIESKKDDDTTDLRAKKFVAQFGDNGRLAQLAGHSGVEVQRQFPKRAPELTSAEELAVTFGANGQWDTVEEFRNIHFQQGDRQATAEHAKIVRSTGFMNLDGSPVLSDAESRTTASSVEINQKSGEIGAAGGVVSTVRAGRKQTMSLGSGPAHISAERMSGSTTSGHVVYARHARLWQGDAVLDADRIEIWRDENKMQAAGHVVAVFPQDTGPLGKPAGKSSAQEVWEVRAPLLTFWNDQGKARLEGGVTASSQQGSLESRTLDTFLGPADTGSNASVGNDHSFAARQLTRVVAQGNVVVRQGSRRGTADRAEYTASDGRFVLTGGPPTLADDSGNTATGHSLTFFVANDTILIESQEGSRTLTKHRVEK
jgi:lipopolysaccharide export system protein LptA